MTHVTIKCPHCGYPIRREFNKHIHLGCPIIRCPHCGHTSYDTNTKEYLCMSDDERALYLESGDAAKKGFSAVFVGLFGIALIVIGIISINDGANSGIIALILGLFFLISSISYFVAKQKGKDRLNRMIDDQEIIDSLKRTSDSEYVEMLKQHKCHIYPVDLSKYYDKDTEMTLDKLFNNEY